MRVAEAVLSGARMRMDAHRNTLRRPSGHTYAIMTAVLCLHVCPGKPVRATARARLAMEAWIQHGCGMHACTFVSTCAACAQAGASACILACTRRQHIASMRSRTMLSDAPRSCLCPRAEPVSKGPGARRSLLPAGSSRRRGLQRLSACLTALAARGGVSKGAVHAPGSSRRQGIQRLSSALQPFRWKVGDHLRLTHKLQ